MHGRTRRQRSSYLAKYTTKSTEQAGGLLHHIEVVPVLSSEYNPDTYSARHIEIISDYVKRHGIAPEDATAWPDDLLECAQLGEYFFSLNRYVFAARKP